jgi:hypothetical protein
MAINRWFGEPVCVKGHAVKTFETEFGCVIVVDPPRRNVAPDITQYYEENLLELGDGNRELGILKAGKAMLAAVEELYAEN